MRWLFALLTLAFPGLCWAPSPEPRDSPMLYPIKCFAIRATVGPKLTASYYHDALEGMPTTSGEIYRGKLMTAAHKTLPLGSEVTLCRGDRPRICATVRINDRGPWIKGRDFDLSKAAARKLGMLRQGLIKVIVNTIKLEE